MEMIKLNGNNRHQPDNLMTIEFAELAENVFNRQGFLNIPHFELHRKTDLLSFI